MSIDSKVEEAINQQINNELGSFYRYLASAAWLETGPYSGFAQWMRIQAEEEKTHAMKLFDYLIDRQGEVKLAAIPDPNVVFSKPIDVFEASLSWEEEVTAQINGVYAIAQEKRDYATMNFLGWFLDEQVEEEKTTSEMVDRLRLAGDDPTALLSLDNAAANRAAIDQETPAEQ